MHPPFDKELYKSYLFWIVPARNVIGPMSLTSIGSSGSEVNCEVTVR